MVRPCASTPQVEERKHDADRMLRHRRRRQRRDGHHDHRGDAELSSDIQRHVRHHAAVDQHVPVDLDRREHPGECRAGNDRQHDVAGLEGEGAPGCRGRWR